MLVLWNTRKSTSSIIAWSSLRVIVRRTCESGVREIYDHFELTTWDLDEEPTATYSDAFNSKSRLSKE